MFRLVGPSRAVWESVPSELVPVFWVVTLLGSSEFLILVLSLAYWNLDDHREAVLRVVGVGFVAIAVTLALKYWFALPRPPAAVQRYPVTPDGFGFPSGHAIAATVVYGAVLVVTDRLREPRVAVPVAVGVLLIGLSRVVLGVHYLGDVLVGFAVGLVVLGASTVALGDDARLAFAAAAVLSVAALVTSGLDPDALLAAGGSVGGVFGTYVPERLAAFHSRVGQVALNAAGLVLAALALLGYALVGSIPVAVFLTNLALVFAIVALPGLVSRSGLFSRLESLS